jgi:hypothetical protein
MLEMVQYRTTGHDVRSAGTVFFMAVLLTVEKMTQLLQTDQ